MPKIYTIPSSLPFAETLVRGILEKYGNDPLTLVDITLLLPNRRSCRSVQEAFLRVTGGIPTFLPKMQPLGDVGDEDFTFKISLGVLNADLPPVISTTKQRLLLAQLIEKFQGGYIGKNKITTAQSAHLAVELSTFLDEVQRQQLSFDGLRAIVPEELARHWQITLDFMDIIIKNWPEILAEKGVSDAGTHRNLSLKMLAKYWKENPPQNPVIAAGSTGSIPATANLLKVIANIPQGGVILPGLDQIMDNDSWENITETHPQSGLKALLESLGAERMNVAEWIPSSFLRKEVHREQLISQIMLPATSSDKWQKMEVIPDTAVVGISRIYAPTLQDEARVIALLFRDTLEVKGKTAALITNDQNLASRVMGIMERWEVRLDNSSGKPLSEVTPCVFMRLIIRMVEEKMAPISLLACLKHPMSCFGEVPGKFKAHVREIEREVLRGLSHRDGITGIKNVLEEKGKANLAQVVSNIELTFKPLIQLMRGKTARFSEIIAAHIKVAEGLAITDAISGAEHLWGHDEGEALKEFFDELLEAAPALDEIQPMQYPSILEALLVSKTYRPKYGSHPRLAILSPMEARMQSFDLCILGSLNEGSWPPMVEAGPWMSRPMRKSFGLPLPERQIGQSAHDFVQAFHAPNIILTRSQKIDGTATIPSRWLMRLDAVLGICGKQHLLESYTHWLEWAKALDEPTSDIVPCAPPAPTPPISARPVELSVTQVEKLMRDPYSHYADKILRLKKLDPIDMEASVREFGDIVHKVIESFVTSYDNIPQASKLEFMLDCWKNSLLTKHIPSAIQAFWQPRFESIAAEFVQREQIRRKDLSGILGEVKGSYVINLDDGREFKITARADRIELGHNGKITIIDYKTKASILSIAKGVLNGTLPQLPLEALIANNEGFEGVNGGYTEDMEYWFMTGGNDKKKAINEDKIVGKLSDLGGMEKLLEITEFGIIELANIFAQQSTPYKSCPDPENEPDFNDYEHLARKKEW